MLTGSLLVAAVLCAASDPANPSTDELLKRLDGAPELAGREKTFEIAFSMGRLYFTHGRYPQAAQVLSEAVQKGEPLRKLAGGVKGTAVSPECAPGPGTTLEGQLSRASGMADRRQAAACALAALEPVLEAQTVRAHALLLEGKSTEALAEHEAVLAVAPDRGENLFSRGALLLELRPDNVGALKASAASFERYLKAHPAGPRAARAGELMAWVNRGIAAGGLAKVRPAPPAPVASAPPSGEVQLTPQMVEAVQNTERTPELAAGLAKLVEEGEAHLVGGRYQEALDAYKRVVPFEPNNGRARAGMAWSLQGLNKQPMADRVWSVAASSDPAALEALGDALLAKGNAKDAKALWTKLAATAPGYQGKLQAKLK